MVKRVEVIREIEAEDMEELKELINDLDDQTMLILPFYDRRGCEISDRC